VNLAGARLPQRHDSSGSGRLARAVPAQQHGRAALRHDEIDTMQNMIWPDFGLDLIELQKGRFAVSHEPPLR